MHAFHEHLVRQLSDKLRRRRFVVWYDERLEFGDFIDELTDSRVGESPLVPVRIGDVDATVATLRDSVIRLRLLLEPLVAGPNPPAVLVYLPGIAAHPRLSMLLELEAAGERIGDTSPWSLKRQARQCLSRLYTDGRIDELLRGEQLGYGHIVDAIRLADGGGGASPLRLVFPDVSGMPLLARWIAEPGSDALIEDRGAAGELFSLVSSRLGLQVPPTTSMADARTRVVRHALLAEFRSDLAAPPPAALQTVPMPEGEALRHCRDLARALRDHHADDYGPLADAVAADFQLPELGVPPTALGAIDTFRFEEVLLLDHAVERTAAGDFPEALAVIEGRRRSFWVDGDLRRQTQWEACRRTVALGAEAKRVRAEMGAGSWDAASLVGRYAESWYRLDRLQRDAEAYVTRMDEEPICEPALSRVRRAVEATLEALARTFCDSLVTAGWSAPGVLNQGRIYPDFVAPSPGPVAWFWVDALRFEMADELRDLLREARDLRLLPALAALPTITRVGMAALLPGASGSFSVGEHGGELTALVEGIPLREKDHRVQYLRGRVPGVRDLTLQALLERSPKKLGEDVQGAPLLVVRSQEIDSLGEAGGAVAREVMGTVVANLARAVRKLAALGWEHFVITADHGHQFALRKETDMTVEAPGGQAVDVHRRCWVGRGGRTPGAAVRASAADLGYQGDLDFVFPRGLGVFPAGGDLSFHHGGISLQEMVIPVLAFQVPRRAASGPARNVRLADLPARITNRIFTAQVTLSGLFPRRLRVVLVDKDRAEEVGEAGFAVDGQYFDQAGKILSLPGNVGTKVALLLARGDVELRVLRVLVLDADTGATLAESDPIPVHLSDRA